MELYCIQLVKNVLSDLVGSVCNTAPQKTTSKAIYKAKNNPVLLCEPAQLGCIQSPKQNNPYYSKKHTTILMHMSMMAHQNVKANSHQ